MESFADILVSGTIGFAFGISSGVLMEKWRERKQLRADILDRYLVEIHKKDRYSDDFATFGAFQRAGAWRLNQRELLDLLEELSGRGLPNPCGGWQGCFPHMKHYPKDLLMWAKKEGVDFDDPDAALVKMASELDATGIPKVSRGGCTLV